MRTIILFLAILCTTASANATTYYLANASTSPVGNDSNNGTSPSTPWLTPNHALNCGDVVQAAASTSYSWLNFTITNWGTVTCAAGNNVAWLTCVTFDACKIIGGTTGIYVDHSYWGVQGWEVNVTSNSGAGCFMAVPNYTTQVSVHHIIFANDIANGCFSGGFVTGASGTGSADYIAIIGNIAYNAAASAAGSNCYSNIDVFEPSNVLDSLPGTHLYFAGNFSWGAMNSVNCAPSSNPATDGEGINVDSLNLTSGSFTYTGQVVVDNNIVIGNGGRGIEAEYNNAGSPNAHIYIRHNTSWDNNLDATQNAVFCPEVGLYTAFSTEIYANLSVTNAATGCMSNPIYAYQVYQSVTTTDRVYNNYGYSAAGNNTNSTGSTGFSFGPSNAFTNPQFSNPTVPGAPSCGSFSSVPACMATIIANFTPTASAAKGYGYQIPSTTCVYDPLYPQWLSSVTNLPSGLVTPGCVTGSAVSGASLSGVTVK